MAQNVTPRTDPPGWRAEQELIECLKELADQATAVRASIRDINDEEFGERAGHLLDATTDLIAVHWPEPRDGVTEDLEILERVSDNLRVPRIDPVLGVLTDTLKELRSAIGLLLRAIQDARRAAASARGSDGVPRQAVAFDLAIVRAMSRRLDRVERELVRVRQEKDTAPRFVQQTGLVNLYVDKMRVKLDLARLLLTIGDVTFDLGALSGAVQAMGEITARFQAAVKAWAGRVSEGLTKNTKTIAAAVLRAVRADHALARIAIWRAERIREPVSPPASARDELDMVLIQPGSFTMGIPEAESKREETGDYDRNARPRHRVTIRRPFLLGRYPVTRGEYAEFARETNREWKPPGFEQTDRHPAVNVSFEDAVAYAKWLSRRTGHHYRLPTEAEWEYACRAGNPAARYWGERPDRTLANFDRKGTTEAGAYQPNPWGLHDMLGNVWEWVEDTWHGTYEGAPDDGRAWMDAGDPGRRVLRGGSWTGGQRGGRAGLRGRIRSGVRLNDAGFRLARTL